MLEDLTTHDLSLTDIDKILSTNLFTIGDETFTIGTLIVLSALMLIGHFVSIFVARGTKKLLEQTAFPRAKCIVVSKVVHFTTWFFALTVSLSVVGVEISALFAAGAAFAVVLGFALQHLAQNFVSGVILLLEGRIRRGDIIEYDSRIVQVQTIGLRSTLARTFDEDELIIPNKELADKAVHNRSLSDTLVRVQTQVSVAYGVDPDNVSSVLKSAVEKHEFSLKSRDPLVNLIEFADSGLLYEVSMWTKRPSKRYRDRGLLNTLIYKALRDAQIEIPYPHLQLNIANVDRLEKNALNPSENQHSKGISQRDYDSPCSSPFSVNRTEASA